MLDFADTDTPHPQKLEQGEVAPYTHCGAHSKSYFKNPPTPPFPKGGMRRHRSNQVQWIIWIDYFLRVSK